MGAAIFFLSAAVDKAALRVSVSSSRVWLGGCRALVDPESLVVSGECLLFR
jgi:hypothetical protein